MTWEQVLAYLDARPPRGERRGLERMRALMHDLGDPQAQVSFVHIAGTSGKGSTAAFTESILRACGYRTGLFLSPHVYDFRERIQLGGEMASPELLAQVFTEMRPALDRFDAAGDPCAYFEVLTALALRTFARAGVQVGVLEVGIGGLLDSTNVIPPPLAAAVCAISLEHTNILGSTLSEIAAQKCGILKPGTRAAGYCDLAPEARAVLEETCRREKIPLHVADPSRLTIERETGHGSEFTYAGETWRVSLAGRHQVYNALTALMLVRCLREGGLALPDAGVARGLEQASLAGRMEIVREDPICILDGAHNPGKMAALMSSIPAGAASPSWASWSARPTPPAPPWPPGGAGCSSPSRRRRGPICLSPPPSWPRRPCPSARRSIAAPLPGRGPAWPARWRERMRSSWPAAPCISWKRRKKVSSTPFDRFFAKQLLN